MRLESWQVNYLSKKLEKPYTTVMNWKKYGVPGHAVPVVRRALNLAPLPVEEAEKPVFDSTLYFDINAASDRLGLAARTVGKMCFDGRLPGIKQHGKWWVRRDYVNRFSRLHKLTKYELVERIMNDENKKPNEYQAC